jgi:hypothetical protein
MPAKSGSHSKPPQTDAQEADSGQPASTQWEYLELLVGVGNEIWDSSGRKMELREIQVGDPRFPRHYYSAAPLLNELGREGWEVTGIIGDLSTYILVLKRRLRAKGGEAEGEAAEEPTPRRATRSVSQRLQAETKASE